MSETTPQTFKCGLCLEEENGTPHIIDETPVCADCITSQIFPLFQNALQHEYNFPPKWGNTILKVRDFAYVLDPIDPSFVKRYESIAAEYSQPYDTRIYCRHKIEAATATPKGEYITLGEKIALSPDRIQQLSEAGEKVVECGHVVICLRPAPEARLALKVTCWHCGGQVCDCGNAVEDDYKDHICTVPDEPEHNLEDEGLVRGRDFQLCPSCAIPIYLNDGCNAISCACGIEFCYICGGEHSHDDGHWNEGSACPRWGQPESGTWDDPNAVAEDDDHAFEDLALGLARRWIEDLADRLQGRENADPTAEDVEWRRNREDEIRRDHGQAVLNMTLVLLNDVIDERRAQGLYILARVETTRLADGVQEDTDQGTRDFLEELRRLPTDIRDTFRDLFIALRRPQEFDLDVVRAEFATIYVDWGETVGDIEERGFKDQTRILQEYWNEMNSRIPEDVMAAITALEEAGPEELA